MTDGVGRKIIDLEITSPLLFVAFLSKGLKNPSVYTFYFHIYNEGSTIERKMLFSPGHPPWKSHLLPLTYTETCCWFIGLVTKLGANKIAPNIHASSLGFSKIIECFK